MEQVKVVFDNKYFKYYRLFLSINGLWPYESQIVKWIRRIITLSLIIFALGIVVRSIKETCSQKNARLCSESIVCLFYYVGFIAKYIVTILNETKMTRTYKNLAYIWLNLVDPEEHAIMRNCAKRNNFLNMSYVAYMVISCIVYSGFSFLNPFLDFVLPLNQTREKFLIQNVACPVDENKYFYHIMAIEFVIVATTFTGAISIDVMYTTNVQQSVGIIIVLKRRLQIALDQFKGEILESAIISAIKLHQTAIELIEIVNATYNLCNLILAGVSVVIYGVGTITLIENMHDRFIFARNILFLLGVAMHMLFITYHGQDIINNSNDLFTSLYKVKWYNLSKRNIELLKIMMARSFKPCELTVRGLFTLDFATYGKIVKSSVSYVTIAISVRSSKD